MHKQVPNFIGKINYCVTDKDLPAQFVVASDNEFKKIMKKMEVFYGS